MPGSATVTSDWEKYGIPPRQSSMALWAHLLGKDRLPAPPDSEVVPPPIAPLDKNGTSMRILLHDTQAHLERFSVRADKLFSSVEETRREITTVNALFQREHETLRDDMVDLVNRSQTELQKAIGGPAQASTLERLTKDVDRRLEALDKRIDAIQALSQSQGQTFQIQSQTLHTIQEQQGTMIAALMPLLPLLQAIPLHIESAHNNLKDTIAKSSKTPVHTPNYLRPAPAISSTRMCREKRTSSTLRSDGLSSPSPRPNKKPRMCVALPRSDQTPKYVEDAASATQETLSKAGKHPIILDPHIATVSSSLNRQNSNAIAANLKTPRRPLADLFVKTEMQTQVPSLTRTSTSQSISTTSRSNFRVSSPPNASSSPHLFGITPSAKRPPRLSRVHPPTPDVSGVVRAQAPAEAAPKQAFREDVRSAGEKDENTRWSLHAKAGVQPSDQLSTSLLSLAPSASVQPTVISRTSLAPATPSVVVPCPSSLNPALPIPRQTQLVRSGIPPLPPQPQLLLTTQEARLTRSSMKPIPMSSMGIRERRSPFREGRRFIPLQDSDDEDEIE